MDLDETLAAVQEDKISTLDVEKQHLHLLVKTFEEQNTKLAETNIIQELIALLRQAEFDRRNLDREIHAYDIERERARDEQRDIDLKEQQRLNNEALLERERTTNQRQYELIDLIQNLQTATARVALDTLTIAQTPKARNLNSAQTIFSGNTNENVDEWLYNTKLNLDMAHISNDEQVKMAATYLKQVAQQFYRHKIQTSGEFTSWDQFQQDMRQQYLPPNYNATLLINLEKLKHTDTVEKYVHDFLYIANQLHDVSDFVKVHIFTSNLQHEIGTEVRYKKPTNLIKAIQIATDYENSKKINQSTEINFIRERSYESK